MDWGRECVAGSKKAGLEFLSLSNPLQRFTLLVQLHYQLYLESHLSQGITISGDTAFSQIDSVEAPFYTVLPNLREMSFFLWDVFNGWKTAVGHV